MRLERQVGPRSGSHRKSLRFIICLSQVQKTIIMKYVKSRWSHAPVIALSLDELMETLFVIFSFLCFILFNESSFEGLLSLGAPSPV